MMKRLLFILTILTIGLMEAQAVLKERDLEQTLEILRAELTEYHRNLSEMTAERKQRNEAIINQLVQTMKQSNQNQLMLYSQKQNYVFDLTYACHQATEQYNEFKRSQIPFKTFLRDVAPVAHAEREERLAIDDGAQMPVDVHAARRGLCEMRKRD